MSTQETTQNHQQNKSLIYLINPLITGNPHDKRIYVLMATGILKDTPGGLYFDTDFGTVIVPWNNIAMVTRPKGSAIA